MTGGSPQFVPAEAPSFAFPPFGQWIHRPRLMHHSLNSCGDGIVTGELQRLGGQARPEAVSAWQVIAPLQNRHPQSPLITSPASQHVQASNLSPIFLPRLGWLRFLQRLFSGSSGSSFDDIVSCFGLSLQALGTKDLLHMLKVQRMHPPYVLLDLFHFATFIPPLTGNTWKRREGERIR